LGWPDGSSPVPASCSSCPPSSSTAFRPESIRRLWRGKPRAGAEEGAAPTAADGSRHVLAGWTYVMTGPVELSDDVEITVERVGRVVCGGLSLEVTCRINKQVVSRASAYTFAPKVAYVYPGQGIQSAGMGLDERTKSKAVDEVWRRADAHTRSAMGFSILTIVRDNPTEIVARTSRVTRKVTRAAARAR